jgi:hypothetical protein
MQVFVVTDHIEVEPNNFSTEVVKVFSSHADALAFRSKLLESAEFNETVEIDTVELV